MPSHTPRVQPVVQEDTAGLRLRKVVPRALLHVLAVVLLVIHLVPVIWVLSSSFRTNVNMYDPDQWIPHPATTVHYTNLFTFLPNMGRYLVNTIRIAGLSTIGQLLSCSMAAYALARLHFPGRKTMVLILLLTMMVPAQATLVPVYVLFRRLGWINTPLPFIVPAFFGGAYGTFFFRQFFLTIPRELEDAALVDGATRTRIYWSIIVPLSTPAFVTMGILSFVGAWNAFFGPNIFLQKQDQWTLTQGLNYLTGRYTSEWGEIMAGVVLMSLPIVVLYLAAQRYFVEGITFTGIKA
jgi:multiple sugar transport system permease protein